MPPDEFSVTLRLSLAATVHHSARKILSQICRDKPQIHPLFWSMAKSSLGLTPRALIMSTLLINQFISSPSWCHHVAVIFMVLDPVTSLHFRWPQIYSLTTWLNKNLLAYSTANPPSSIVIAPFILLPLLEVFLDFVHCAALWSDNVCLRMILTNRSIPQLGKR